MKITKTKEYLTLTVQADGWKTQELLNNHARDGWRLVCSYAKGYWLIMERDIELEWCDCCGKLKKRKSKLNGGK